MNIECYLELQHFSFPSHLQLCGSCKQQLQITIPQPTQVLLDTLQAQCLHVFMHIFNYCGNNKNIILKYD